MGLKFTRYSFTNLHNILITHAVMFFLNSEYLTLKIETPQCQVLTIMNLFPYCPALLYALLLEAVQLAYETLRSSIPHLFQGTHATTSSGTTARGSTTSSSSAPRCKTTPSSSARPSRRPFGRDPPASPCWVRLYRTLSLYPFTPRKR